MKKSALDLLTAILLLPGLALAAETIPKRPGPHIMPKKHPELFRVASAPSGATLSYYGGRVISHVEVVQVLWGTGNYLPEVLKTTSPSIGTFFQEVLNSAHIDWLTEYDTDKPAFGGGQGTNQHIGHGAFVGQVTITPSTTANKIDDKVIQAELIKQIEAGHLPTPSTDAAGNNNTYYAVFFPHGKTITESSASSCQDFCAYHGTIAATSKVGEFYYGVHPDFQAGSGCDSGCGNASSTFDNVTSVVSHEVVEAITDAEVGLATSDAPPLAWYNDTYGEIGDICNDQQGTILGSDGVTYTVQKEYSNVAKNCIVTRAATGDTAPAITSANNAVFVAGKANSFTLTATGSPEPHFSISGQLPSGLRLSSSGTISGTPASSVSGTYQFTVVASNGTAPDATQNFILTVQNFSISSSTPSQTVSGGQSGVYTISLASVDGFTQTLGLTCGGGPSGSQCSVSPNSVTLNGTATVKATITVPKKARHRTYQLWFKGKAGTLSHTANASLTIH